MPSGRGPVGTAAGPQEGPRLLAQPHPATPVREVPADEYSTEQLAVPDNEFVLLLAEQAGRTSATILNVGTTTVWIGRRTATKASGFPLLAGAAYTTNGKREWFGSADTGGGMVAIVDEYTT